jgi:four helix bundle protein
MKDPLEKYPVHIKAMDLFDKAMEDSEFLMRDIRGREIVKQLTRTAGSISANIEEGYGRGYPNEFLRHLKISRGSARETKGWYIRSKRFLNSELIDERTNEIDEIISLLVSMINNLGFNKK